MGYECGRVGVLALPHSTAIKIGTPGIKNIPQKILDFNKAKCFVLSFQHDEGLDFL